MNTEAIWGKADSKREKWTITNEETWFVENGEKVKLCSKREVINKELIREGQENLDKEK